MRCSIQGWKLRGFGLWRSNSGSRRPDPSNLKLLSGETSDLQNGLRIVGGFSSPASRSSCSSFLQFWSLGHAKQEASPYGGVP